MANARWFAPGRLLVLLGLLGLFLSGRVPLAPASTQGQPSQQNAVKVATAQGDSDVATEPKAKPKQDTEQETDEKAPEEAHVIHPHQLTPLTRDCEFPRFTYDILRKAGYPDHLHLFYFKGYVPPVDENGQPYGPLSICQETKLHEREGLVIEPERIRYGVVDLSYNAFYKPCQLMLFVELADLGQRTCRELLDLATSDTLHVVNTNNVDEYRATTGYGVWRTYKLSADSCVVEPIPVLTARTLIGHTALEVIVRWNLQRATGNALPPWFQHGLADYISDSGAHLNEFMAEFRSQGPVLMDPQNVNAVFSAPPLPDDSADRKTYRMARYSAFLMAWHLVEDNGGLVPLRAFLAKVAAGRNADRSCYETYGVDLGGLAAKLNPLDTGEPIGEANYPTRPHVPLY